MIPAARKQKALRELGYVAVFLAAATQSPAVASGYQWIGQITEDGASLGYAIPGSDGIKIDFHCDRKTRKIVVNYDREPKGITNGAAAEIRLSLRGRGPSVFVAIPARGRRLKGDDLFALQGETRMTAGLRRILSEAGTLLVTVEGRVEEIPLQGIKTANRQLFAACPF